MAGPAFPDAPLFRRCALLLLAGVAASGAQAQVAVPAAIQPVAFQPASLTATDARATLPGAVVCTADLAAAALARLNALRASGGDCRSGGRFGPAPALSWDARLRQAALAHSQDMATRDYFSHISADGRSPGSRIAAAGYAWRGLAENIAAGPLTLDDALATWLQSDAHCAQLMSARHREVGLACVPGAVGSTYGSYWTLDLGAAR